MKAVIGVDLNDQWVAPVELFIRLQFQDPEALVLHSLEWVTTGGFFPPIQVEAELTSQRRTKAKSVIEDACKRLTAVDIPSEQFMAEGDPVRSLTAAADGAHADLIITGSGRKGRFGSLYFGSSGKGLVTAAHQSILIGKVKLEHQRPLTAVLATDHSEYVDKCIDKLLELNPRGIGRIVVITANEASDYYASLLLEYNIPNFDEEVVAWATSQLQKKTDAVCSRIKPLNAQCTGKVISRDPATAIHSTMIDEKADLLILGAQGHGFVERMLIGSTALYETVIEPFNTLILRVDPG